MCADYTPLFALQKLVFSPLCRACNKELLPQQTFCFSCQKQFLRFSFDLDSYFFSYEGPIPALIRDLRNLEGWNTPNLLLGLMRRKNRIERWANHYDAIVLAPSSKKNGMSEFALVLARVLGIEWIDCLEKTKRTQHNKNAYERMDAICFVYFKPNFSVYGKRILLLDDVSTTGTTLTMSAYILRKNGAIVDSYSLAHKMVPGLERKSQ